MPTKTQPTPPTNIAPVSTPELRLQETRTGAFGQLDYEDSLHRTRFISGSTSAQFGEYEFSASDSNLDFETYLILNQTEAAFAVPIIAGGADSLWIGVSDTETAIPGHPSIRTLSDSPQDVYIDAMPNGNVYINHDGAGSHAALFCNGQGAVTAQINNDGSAEFGNLKIVPNLPAPNYPPPGPIIGTYPAGDIFIQPGTGCNLFINWGGEASHSTVFGGSTPGEQVAIIDDSGNAVFNGSVTVGADPTQPLELATKQYVDSHAGSGGGGGTQGPPGPQGPTGPKGPQGPQGPTGAQGATGPQGPAGPQGTAGAQGAQGATGSQGPIGPAGATGPAPQIIEVADQATAIAMSQSDPKNLYYWPGGTIGPQGPAGPQGPQGPPGPQGPQGPPGSGGGGSMTYPAAGLAVSTGSAWGTSLDPNNSFLPLAGGTMSGNLVVNQQVSATNSSFVLNGSGIVAIARGSSWLMYAGYFGGIPGGSDQVNNVFSNAPLFVARNPLNPMEVTPKQYVDATVTKVIQVADEATAISDSSANPNNIYWW